MAGKSRSQRTPLRRTLAGIPPASEAGGIFCPATTVRLATIAPEPISEPFKTLLPCAIHTLSPITTSACHGVPSIQCQSQSVITHPQAQMKSQPIVILFLTITMVSQVMPLPDSSRRPPMLKHAPLAKKIETPWPTSKSPLISNVEPASRMMLLRPFRLNQRWNERVPRTTNFASGALCTCTDIQGSERRIRPPPALMAFLKRYSRNLQTALDAGLRIVLKRLM